MSETSQVNVNGCYIDLSCPLDLSMQQKIKYRAMWIFLQTEYSQYGAYLIQN